MDASNKQQAGANDQESKVGARKDIETMFRHCPYCGKRFEIRLVGKKLVDTKSIREQRPVNSDYFGGYSGSVLEVGNMEPAIVEVETFQYAYKCKHCGHQWVEIKQEEHKE
ncbi:MAG: hypothetical protein ACHQ1H_01470 [Nitrososphaerales archaeon]